ncbi:hypothetical protein BGZ50_004538 [Haplosporangium sp. Z 11]|nr:hypothetical protein BGZ50_004538 [Haplosporangium sp. Z 11]
MSPKDLPVLTDYDISPVTGFLPAEEPLEVLPDPYFAPWEETFRHFNGLLLASRIRQRVKEVLPASLAVPWQKVADMLEIQPVLTHAAVVMWNWRLLYKDGPRDLDNLGTLATLSGSSDESWFYLVTTAIEATGAPVLDKILRSIQLVRDDNLTELIQELHGIRGIIEELVAVLRRMFEKCDPYVFYWKVRPYLAGWENMAEAGLPNGVRYEGVDNGEYKKLAGGSAAQSSLIHALDIAFGVEHHPTGFRPKKNAAGHANGTANGVANGTANGNVDAKTVQSHNSYNDSSNMTEAMSPDKGTGSTSNNFIKKMRFYMPGPHRNFLTHLTEVANIRKFVTDKAALKADGHGSSEIDQLITVFDECVHQIKVFRDVHIQMVTLYIVMQANRGPSISHGGFAPLPHAQRTGVNSVMKPVAKDEQPVPSSKGSSILYPQKVIFGAPHGLAKKQEAGNDVVRGTGGTDLIPFLRQSRDETNESKIVPTPTFARRKSSVA